LTSASLVYFKDLEKVNTSSRPSKTKFNKVLARFKGEQANKEYLLW